eukprot:2114270-Heterocapsa_arctica.AAC.1
MKDRMKGDAKLSNYSGMRTKHIGAKMKRLDNKRLHAYRSQHLDNRGNRMNYRLHMRSCLAQTSKELIVNKSANGSSPLERWGRLQGARRTPAIQARKPTLARETAGQ